MGRICLLFLLIVCLVPNVHSGNILNPEWQSLFDGKSLDDWVQHGGKAKYSIQDNMIIGESVNDTPDSFLCTSVTYGNFILELEFWVDDEMNSGIQIRSHSFPDYQDGQVHGYQVEIDPTERAWSGGIYDESRRGWLYDLRQNEAARKAFKHNSWNKLHIEAVGPVIRTWLNDVPAAYLIDGMTADGFIALQVHKMDRSGVQVKWRNIKIMDLGTASEFPQIIRTKSE